MAGKTALLLEDDDDYRQVLEEFLSDFDYAVTSYPSPLTFIESSTHCASLTPCYDIVITDNQMPGMDGIDFLRLLHDNGCKIRADRKVLISGFLTREVARTAEALGSRSFKKLTAMDDLCQWLGNLPA